MERLSLFLFFYFLGFVSARRVNMVNSVFTKVDWHYYSIFGVALKAMVLGDILFGILPGISFTGITQISQRTTYTQCKTC